MINVLRLTGSPLREEVSLGGLDRGCPRLSDGNRHPCPVVFSPQRGTPAVGQAGLFRADSFARLGRGVRRLRAPPSQESQQGAFGDSDVPQVTPL